MIYTINSDNLSVGVRKKGAEICSVKLNDREFLWQGDSSFWSGQSPLLFPLVGPMHSEKIGGMKSDMKNHGFLKEMEFDLIEQSGNHIILEAVQNQDTLKLYPFKFRILAKFKVNGKTLESFYTVINEQSKEMVYSFGLHPAFYCNDTNFEDYYIEFPENKTIRRCRFEETGVSFENTDLVCENQKQIVFNRDMFSKTVIINDIDFNEIKYSNTKEGELFSFSFSGFNIFSMWQPQNAPFVCLEPWRGYNGLSNHTENVEENLSVKFLKGNESDVYSMTISFV